METTQKPKIKRGNQVMRQFKANVTKQIEELDNKLIYINNQIGILQAEAKQIEATKTQITELVAGVLK